MGLGLRNQMRLGAVSGMQGGGAPAAPVLSAATDVWGRGFDANWTKAVGATGYLFDLSTSATFDTYVTGYNDKELGDVDTLTITGLEVGTQYYYRLKSTNASGASAESAASSAVETLWGIYTKAEIDALVSDGYVPIASAEELNASRTASDQTFGAGTYWQGTYLSGTGKKFVQVRDISLSAYADGAGWVALPAMTYDGAGCYVTDLRMVCGTTNVPYGLFGIIETECRNVICVNGYVQGTGAIGSAGILIGRTWPPVPAIATIEKCVTSGIVIAVSADYYRYGGIAGALGYNTNCYNCYSNVIVISGNRQSPLFGNTYPTAGNTINLEKHASAGWCSTKTASSGGISGWMFAGTNYSDCYCDNTIGDYHASSYSGTKKTTAEMLDLAALSTGEWENVSNRYPRLTKFRDLPCYYPPCTGLTGSINGNTISLSWTAASNVPAPDSYTVYAVRTAISGGAVTVDIVKDIATTSYAYTADTATYTYRFLLVGMWGKFNNPPSVPAVPA